MYMYKFILSSSTVVHKLLFFSYISSSFHCFAFVISHMFWLFANCLIFFLSFFVVHSSISNYSGSSNSFFNFFPSIIHILIQNPNYKPSQAFFIPSLSLLHNLLDYFYFLLFHRFIFYSFIVFILFPIFLFCPYLFYLFYFLFLYIYS